MTARRWTALALFALIALAAQAVALPVSPAATPAVQQPAATAPAVPAWSPAILQTPAGTAQPTAAPPPLAPQIHCPLVCPGGPCHVFNGCLVCEC